MRVHRTFLQRFNCLAVYTCADCQEGDFILRQHAKFLRVECCCPQCGTHRVVRLTERDHIDKMRSGLFNLLERLLGGDIYHCRYCRLQFYDSRPLSKRPMRQRATDAEQPDSAPLD